VSLLWVVLLGGCGPSFEQDVEPILYARCVGCHQGEGAEAGLDLGAGPYAALMDAESTQSDMMLIEPGSSLYSYAFHKVNGTQGIAGGAGTTMPLGNPLSDEELTAIADWIDAGARP